MTVPISGLNQLNTPPQGAFDFVVVDTSDTAQGPSGSTKRVTTATVFDSPSITGTPTITGTLAITGGIQASGNAAVGGELDVAGPIVASDAVTVEGALSNDRAVGNPGLAMFSNGNPLASVVATAQDTVRILDHNGVTTAIFEDTDLTIATVHAALAGNANTASALTPGATINGVLFDGTAPITVSTATNATPSAVGVVEVTYAEATPKVMNSVAIPAQVTSADITESSGVATSTGMTQAIANGETWVLRWRLRMSSSAANANGFTLSATLPTASNISVFIRGVTSGTTALIEASGTSALFGAVSALGTFDSSTSTNNAASVDVEVTIQNATSSTTADLKFARATSGSQTMKAASYFEARRVS